MIIYLIRATDCIELRAGTRTLRVSGTQWYQQLCTILTSKILSGIQIQNITSKNSENNIEKKVMG